LGLYKLENVASVVIALFIFLAGYEILRETLSPKAAAPFIPFSYLLLLLAATVATLVFGRYALATGRKTGSPTLIAEGRHRQVDAISSVVVLVSAVFSYLKVPFSVFGVSVDQLGAVLILVFIVHAGWGLLSDGMRVLLDASIDFTTLDEIRKVIEREPLVSEVTSLVGRSAGRFRFIQATVALRTGDLQKAHRVSEQIEIKIRRQVPNLERVLIHYEPVEKPYRVIALPLEDASGKINRHFGEAPYFGVIRLRNADGRIEKQEVIENPHRSVETGKGIRVAEWLVEKGVDLVGMKEDLSKKGPGYVFANAGVKTHLISSDGIPEALSEIGSGVP
jgi:cation diffusion facilitator family transporter